MRERERETTAGDSVRSRGQRRMKGRQNKEREKGERRETGKRKCIEEGKEEEREEKRARQAEKQAPGGWQPSVPGLAAGRWCWGVGTGRRWSPGRRAECLRDVFIP